MKKVEPRNISYQIAKWVVLLILFAMIGFVLLITYFQTPLGKQTVAKQIEVQIGHLSPDIEVSGLEGHFPWDWKIHKISGQIPNVCSFEIDNILFNIDIVSLILGPFRLTSLEIEKCTLVKFPSEKKGREASGEKNHLDSPFLQIPSLAVDHLKIREFTLLQETPVGNENLFSYAVEGKMESLTKKQLGFAELSLFLPGQSQKFLQLKADLQEQNRMNAQLKTFKPITEDLIAFLKVPKWMHNTLFDLHAEGPLKTFEALVYPSGDFLPLDPITLQCKAMNFVGNENLVRLRAFIYPDKSMEISQIDTKLPFLDLQGHGKLDSEFHIMQGYFEFDFKGDFSIEGSQLYLPLKGEIEIDSKRATARAYAKEWRMEDHKFDEITLSMKATHALLWQGNLAIASGEKEERLLATLQFALDSSNFKIEDLELQLPSLTLSSEGSIDLEKNLILANLFLQTDALSQIPFASLLPFEAGKAALEMKLFPIGDEQGAEWSLKAEEGSFEDVRFEEIGCRGSHQFKMETFKDFSPESMISSAQLEGKKIYLKWNYFETVHWNIEKHEKGYNHTLHLEGIAKKPLYLDAKWSYFHHDEEQIFAIDEFHGSWMKLPVVLAHPVRLSIKQNEVSMSDLNLSIGTGSLKGAFLLSEKRLDGKIVTSHFPLTPLSILSPDVSLEGAISSEWILGGDALFPQGHAWVELEPTVLHLEENAEQVVGKGSMQLFLDHHQLQGHLSIVSALGQYLEGQVSIPIATSSTWEKWRFSEEKPFSARLRMEGKIEELVPFLKFDAHRLEGTIDMDLLFSKTLKDPFVQGGLKIHNGLYDNLSYGTHLQNIEIRSIADRDLLIVEEAMGLDGKGGWASLTGKVLLSPSIDFPFDFLASLKKLEILKSDFAEASVTGDLQYKGTLTKAKLSGLLESDKLELKIPDKITEPIPYVDIDFVRLPSHKSLSPSKKRGELLLDLELLLKDRVLVNGRGLSSEWGGNLKVEGTLDHILPTGSLDLVRGKFLFAGKTFTLTEGTIVFDGKDLTPDIRLEGNLAIDGLSVTAVLQGPLDSPQLSFQSIPHLPTSSLLSRLLFNKDVSEINPIQAYQLAQTLLSLSGSGVNILEAIQKSLGIDKLSLVSGKNRFDEVSVQIGKYLYKGVMITLSQSASSSEVMVEVELKKGFIFQAETIEDDGRFTLKWNYNY